MNIKKHFQMISTVCLFYMGSTIFSIGCQNQHSQHNTTLFNNGSIFCSGSNCLAVGRYTNTEGGFVPLLSFSTDGGQTYTSTSAVTLPADALLGANEFAELVGLSCSGSNCLAVGQYKNTAGGLAPLLSFSTDGGHTYTSTSAVTLPADALLGANELAELFSLSCSGSNCLAVGEYLNTAGGLAPLLSFSTDGGQTYTSTSAVTLPADALLGANEFAGLVGLSCSGSNCLAVGQYKNTAGGVAPLLSFSTDGGHTYTSTSAVTLPKDAQLGANELAELFSLSCSGSNCLAVGKYTNTAGGDAPLLSFSTDGGQTYTSTSTVTLPKDAQFGANEFAELIGFSCMGLNCFAVGGYKNTAGGIVPLLSFSTDGGHTYTSTSAVTLPEDAQLGASQTAFL